MLKLKSSIALTCILVLLLAGLSIISILSSCKNYHRNQSHAEVPVSNIREGEVLARRYCQSCHLLPDPSLLNAASWEKGVLPQMGPRLGIFTFNQKSYPSNRFDLSLPRDFYPEKPIMTPTDWQYILDYYTATAPDSLKILKPIRPIQTGLPLFSVQLPSFSHYNPATSVVQIHAMATGNELIAGDALTKNLYRFNNQLQVVDSLHNVGAIVDMLWEDSALILCDIGILNPNNNTAGAVESVAVDRNGKWKGDTTTVFKSLRRPVQMLQSDLNKDGKADYIVCEFGFMTGALCWMENKGNDNFDRHVLRPLPGAIKAYINDYNKDGLPDIWVLFAQGEEGVFLFTNKGNGQFDQQEVLRFPPVYGSSYFEMDDFNKDGFPDIVYTCGDNADYSTILKPYHGVYIFLNDGKNHFKQQYFYHINGCYKAIARDFDGDGDLDIATISFFPDFKNRPEEGFIYLENKGNFDFDPYTIPETQKGRWLTMDAGDLDGDGKTDLVLGNFSIGPTMLHARFDWKNGPPFMLLKNTGKTNTGK